MEHAALRARTLKPQGSYVCLPKLSVQPLSLPFNIAEKRSLALEEELSK